MFNRQVDSFRAGRLIKFDYGIRWLILYKCLCLRLLKLVVVHHRAIIHRLCIYGAFHGLLFVEAFAAIFGVQLLQDRFNVLVGHGSLHFVKVVPLLYLYLCEGVEAAASQVVILIVVV